MRQLLFIVFTMGMFNLFGQSKPKQDPYWEFNQATHYRPHLNKGDFFKLSDFDFGWFVLEPIRKFIGDRENEVIKGESLSFGQKALYYWWYIDAQVRNGGFVQFYYNGYGKYVQTIVKGLLYIGDKEMAELIQRADNIYQKNQKLMDKAKNGDLYGMINVYEELEDLSILDFEYYKLNKKTMSNIERFIREHPNEICLDEDGTEFDLKFTGQIRTFYRDSVVKETFYLKNGIIDGEYMSFFENSKLKELIPFLNGRQTGERTEFYENGNKKYEIRRDTLLNQLEHLSYYENGNKEKLEHKLSGKYEQVGEYKKWYENGQLATIGKYALDGQRIGPWFEFYKDGKKKEEAEFINGEYLLQNYWDKRGKQTVVDGTGLFISDYEQDGYFGDTQHQFEYKNSKKHGTQRTFTDGVLTLYEEMENGIENGYTRSFYKNGKVREETLYKDGTEVSNKKFSKFDNPKVEFKIYSRVCIECYEDEELQNSPKPDNNPQVLNKEKLEKSLKADVSQFAEYNDEHVMNYSYTVKVDREGNLIKIRFSSADNLWIVEEIEESLKKFKYEVALKDGKPIECVYFVQINFT